MKSYEKPVVCCNPELSEGIYAASGSGSGDDPRCRFGKKRVNTNSSSCRKCIRSGGVSVSAEPGEIPSSLTVSASDCPDRMPAKK